MVFELGVPEITPNAAFLPPLVSSPKVSIRLLRKSLFKLYHFACKPQLLELRCVYFFVNSAAIAIVWRPQKYTCENPKSVLFGLKAQNLNKL